MSHPLFGSNYRITPDGIFSAEHVRVCEILSDYNPELEIQWLPPTVRGPDDPAFRLVHYSSNGFYVVMSIDEKDMNVEYILGKVFACDMAKNGIPSLNEWAIGQDRARELHNAKIRQEAIDEAKDLAKSILKSGKANYRHNGKVYD